jgi:ornithine cyclodeaminase
MVTAIGAIRLARPGAAVLGCIGTRGIAVQAARYIARSMPLREIRLHGRDARNTQAAARALADELGVPVIAAPDWCACLNGADILIEGSAQPRDADHFPLAALTPGAVLIAYGAYSTFPVSLMDHVDLLVMDRWLADGRGALGPQTTAGTVTQDRLNALIGEVIAGRDLRENGTDRIVFCHRGVAACDLALASAYLAAAQEQRLGTEISL